MCTPAPIQAMRDAMEQNNWPAAIAVAERWLAEGQNDWRISLNLAVAYSRSRLGGAEHPQRLAEQALQLSDNHPQACLGLAEILTTAGRWEQTLELLDQLPKPQPWLALQLRCEALARLGHRCAALALLEGCPEEQRAWRWHLAMADVYSQDCQWSLVESHLRTALLERPSQREVHVNLALALLSQQRCEEAWPHYGWRASNPRLNAQGIPRALPPLDSLICREVVVVGEQGIGDQLMVSRYLPHLAAHCSGLRIQPAPRLQRLLTRNLPPEVVVEDPGTPLGDAEVIGSASLPLLFWKELGLAASATGGFLTADPQLVTYWNQAMNQLPKGRKLGLGWLGGTSGAEARERSLSEQDLRDLSSWPEVQWIDLQYLPHHRQDHADIAKRAGLHRLGNPGEDLEDSLALIHCLDGVVTTRQTIAHLAGALGKKGQVLVPARPEWRYWGTGNRWAWYPSMELLHQNVSGQWGPQLNQAAQRWRAASN
jgi:tetratricopeptide (TPR) repeat protein